MEVVPSDSKEINIDNYKYEISGNNKEIIVSGCNIGFYS